MMRYQVATDIATRMIRIARPTTSVCARKWAKPKPWIGSMLSSLRRNGSSSFASRLALKQKKIGTSTHAATGWLPWRAGTNFQRLTVSSADSSSRAEPLEVRNSTFSGTPSLETSTRRITRPCSPMRRAIGG